MALTFPTDLSWAVGPSDVLDRTPKTSCRTRDRCILSLPSPGRSGPQAELSAAGCGLRTAPGPRRIPGIYYILVFVSGHVNTTKHLRVANTRHRDITPLSVHVWSGSVFRSVWDGQNLAPH